MFHSPVALDINKNYYLIFVIEYFQIIKNDFFDFFFSVIIILQKHILWKGKYHGLTESSPISAIDKLWPGAE